MKKIGTGIIGIITLIMFIVSCGGTPKVTGADELDMAIRDASDYLNDNIPQGSKIVILNVQSDSAALSDYIIDELIANAVNDRLFEVVDRQQLDLIRTEQNFQWSGEVDDNAALEIGKFFGAQIIVSGRVSQVADRYRFTIRALEVQTARVVGQNNINIAAGRTITALMRTPNTTTASSAASGTRTPTTTTPAQTPATDSSASQGTRQQPAPIVVERQPTPAAQTPLRSGTYTFYPRLRASQGGVDVNAYIDRIVVRGEYLNIYLTNVPIGRGGNPAGEWSHSWRISGNEFFIQDLDRPTRTWVRVNYGDDEVTGGMFLTYQGVTATRFSFTSRSDNPIMVFDEIILGEPD